VKTEKTRGSVSGYERRQYSRLDVSILAVDISQVSPDDLFI